MQKTLAKSVLFPPSPQKKIGKGSEANMTKSKYLTKLGEEDERVCYIILYTLYTWNISFKSIYGLWTLEFWDFLVFFSLYRIAFFFPFPMLKVHPFFDI